MLSNDFVKKGDYIPCVVIYTFEHVRFLFQLFFNTNVFVEVVEVFFEVYLLVSSTSGNNVLNMRNDWNGTLIIDQRSSDVEQKAEDGSTIAHRVSCKDQIIVYFTSRKVRRISPGPIWFRKHFWWAYPRGGGGGGHVLMCL